MDLYLHPEKRQVSSRNGAVRDGVKTEREPCAAAKCVKLGDRVIFARRSAPARLTAREFIHLREFIAAEFP